MVVEQGSCGRRARSRTKTYLFSSKSIFKGNNLRVRPIWIRIEMIKVADSL